MSRANANAIANAKARDVDAGTSRARALEATLESARDAVATTSSRADGVTAFAEASIVNSRDVSDVRARETKEHERESAREASAAIVRRPTPTGKVDVSRQEMLEALARELDETESLLGTTKRTTEGERAMSVASLFAGGERYVAATSFATTSRREEARGGAEAAPSETLGRESRRWVQPLKRARWSAITMVMCACACVAALMFAGETPQARARRHIHLSSLSDMLCEVAFTPAIAEVSNDTPINRVIAATDQIYILTTQNCASVNTTIRVPKEFEGKATCVSGKVLDRCTAASTGVWYKSHYTRVSMSHGMIAKHAKENGFEHITVMEEDAVVNADVEVHSETEADLLTLIGGEFEGESASLGRVKLGSGGGGPPAWKLIRPSVRPHLFEKFEIKKSSTGGMVEVTTATRDDLVCPTQCHCVNTRAEGQLCRLNAGGCDLRSSDMYLLHNTAYDELISELFTGTDDTIIDHYVLQNVDSAWLVHPSITTQAKLDIDRALQHRVQELFEEKCVR